ncbi:Serine/threonine protein kinase [hydrothermal vent metagenome]|uniref:non-specific serine/threonine protein kinase n=1 Tax=hydrothermal vent metagenome TaxID=652676 RepID=A0A3B1AD86_9ZZZZ
MTDDQEEEVYRDVLPQGFEIHWYEVKSVLGRGAFGVTYLALDKNLDQLVAIKEYFPNDFSSRETGYTVHPTTGKNKEMYEWGLNRFIREARTLAKFKHPNIVRVVSVFEHNNTAYMVMEYEQGKELSKLFKEQEHFTEQELLDIFLPVMDGLRLVHDAGFIHRDIKPSNVYIREDGSPVLIDFGSARQVSGTPTRALTSLVTYGYAPFEQYNESEEKQGPWTDIYALGASLYFGLAGKLPIDALTRGSGLLSTGIDPYKPLSVMLEGKYSASFLRAIDHALLFHASERPQDVMLWADMLRGGIEVPELPPAMLKKPPQEEGQDSTVVLTKQPSARHGSTPKPHKGTTAETPPDESQRQTTSQPIKRKPNIRLISTVLVTLVVILVGSILLMRDPGPEDTQTPASETPEPETIVEPTAELVVEQTVDQASLLLTQADQARQAGNYIEPEGKNALQLYSQVLALEPSNQQANKSIEEIIDLYADGIRSDLAEGYFDKAEKNLQLLSTARPDSEKLLALFNELKVARASQSKLSQLLIQADDYLKQNRLLSPKGKNALSTLRRVLEVDPDNKGARKRIETIAVHYIQRAEKEIAAGNLSAASKSIINVKFTDASHPEITNLSRKYAAEKEKIQRRLNSLLARAGQALDKNKYITPLRKNAFYLYQQALKIDSKNIKAKSGIEVVKKKLKIKFDGLVKTHNFPESESLVKMIEKVMPGSRFANTMRAEWAENKPPEKSDIQVIEEMIGSFKQALEARDQDALEEMSEFQTNRKGFVGRLFRNYSSLKLQITNVRIIGKKKTGMADVKITKLVNIQGFPVQPGAWSQFEIEIKQNEEGQWKIYW